MNISLSITPALRPGLLNNLKYRALAQITGLKAGVIEQSKIKGFNPKFKR
jgi:hypothetical protein